MKLRFCAIYFCMFLFVAIGEAFPAQKAKPAELGFNERKIIAAQLLRDNKPKEAYEAFMKLLRESPLDGEVNLGVARSAYTAMRYNQAIMAYDRLIESYPDKAFLHVELAGVYAALKNRANSIRELELALLIDPSLKLLKYEEIERREADKRKTWFVGGNFSLGYGFDSNANSGPYSSKIILGNFPLTLDPTSVQQSSEFGQAIAGLNIIYRKDPQARLLFVADIAFYGKYYIREIVENNNLLWTRAALGMRYHWTTQYLDFRFKGDFAQYPSTRNITTVGADMVHGYIHNDLVTFISRAGYEQRFYKDSPGNDGFYYSVGETVRFSFNKGDQALMIGAKFAQRSAESKMFSNLSGEGSLRMEFRVPWDISIQPFGSYRQDWYDGPGTALELDKRIDGQVRSGLTLSKGFARYLSTDITYQYVKNFSNSPIYRYDQHTVTISFGVQF